MKGVVSVLGTDRPGIIAKVSAVLFENNVNILDIDQTVMREEVFVMTMLIDMSGLSSSFGSLKEQLLNVADELGVQIKLQREEIFKSMHNI